MSRHIFLNLMWTVFACRPDLGDEPANVKLTGADFLTGCVLESRVAIEATREVYV